MFSKILEEFIIINSESKEVEYYVTIVERALNSFEDW